MQDEPEKALYRSLRAVSDDVQQAAASQGYGAVLSTLATLRNDIDDFFDNVMVMADDEAVRQNRLAILLMLRSLFLKTADISLLAKS